MDIFPTLWKKLATPLFGRDVFFHDEVDKELRRWNSPMVAWYQQRVKKTQIIAVDLLELDHYRAVVRWVESERTPAYHGSAVDEFMDAADSWHQHAGTLLLL